MAYTLADNVLTPPTQQVKVLDVKEARAPPGAWPHLLLCGRGGACLSGRGAACREALTQSQALRAPRRPSQYTPGFCSSNTVLRAAPRVPSGTLSGRARADGAGRPRLHRVRVCGKGQRLHPPRARGRHGRQRCAFRPTAVSAERMEGVTAWEHVAIRARRMSMAPRSEGHHRRVVPSRSCWAVQERRRGQCRHPGMRCSVLVPCLCSPRGVQEHQQRDAPQARAADAVSAALCAQATFTRW